MPEKSKVILISGGSRGLGQGIVEHLLKNTSHSVVTFSRKESPFIKQAKKSGKRFYYRQADVSSSSEINSLFKEVQKKFGKIDVLINNAGVASEGILPVFPAADIDRILDINLKSTIHLTRAATRLMIRQKSGNIINVSSILGMRGYSGLSVYSASKAGLLGFTRSLARELGPRNIRVNAIAPGYFETEMTGTLSKGQRSQIIRRTPLGRLGEIKDVVPLIDFLISEGSLFITGHTFVIDGGISC